MIAPVLELQDLRKRFGQTEIIRGASLSVAEGEVHALIGPNGAGKSTLFHLISGRLKPTGGRVLFGGHEVTAKRPEAIARLGIARSFQQTSAFQEMTVSENVAVAAMWAGGERGAVVRSSASMNGVWARVAEVLDLLGMMERRDTPIARLTYSELRALEIGMAIAGEPKLILLDEPTAGMSRIETEEMIGKIRRIACGCTLMLIEHDMNVVFELADTISVLVYGEVLVSGPPSAVREDARVQRAYLGHSSASVGGS